ncbi:heme-dependent oxidative N-demethylase subunit alpha family protein [Thalassoglobus sp. JC818]|uniref:heme-dependent oxidative N-demethylase subunit alpha family protein n=1 Tax=Thalassoglobus sp. JC818 TaxID=3232136 RepID=UPI003459B569
MQAHFHPYRDGYSLLPKLRKISLDEVFLASEGSGDRYRREKQLAMEQQTHLVEENLSTELRTAVTEFLIERHPQLKGRTGPLEQLVTEIEEDIVIHSLDADRDWMSFGHVCFPSGWRPEEKIGRPLAEIHQPIPGMDLSNSRRLVETMVNHGPFERFVWSVVFEDELNFHPDRTRCDFDPVAPVVFVKVERQVTVGVPDSGGALFVLHQSLIPFDQIERGPLVAALRSMSPEQLEYKGLSGSAPKIIEWLTSLPS